MSRVCLTLPGPDCRNNSDILHEYFSCYDAIELRVDRILGDLESIPRFFSDIFDDPALSGPLTGGSDGPVPPGFGFSVILTIRRPEDGGVFGGSPRQAEELYLGILSQLSKSEEWERIRPWLAVDVERESDMPELFAFLKESAITRIRSFHSFQNCPPDLPRLLKELSADGAVPKLAVMPEGLADLTRIFSVGRQWAVEHPEHPAIILGMGKMGMPSRILPEKAGSFLSFTSAGTSVAPGQLDCRVMKQNYRSIRIDARTPVFGIVGNPVAHSKSPEYHNAVFRKKNASALYIPLLCDDPRLLPQLAETLGILGCSVTIPYKETVRHILKKEDDACTRTRACNTILFHDGYWEGRNSDVPGFLYPIREFIDTLLPEQNVDRKATVVGAGGAARAVVYGLLEEGFDLLVLNRSADRLREFIDLFDESYPGRVHGAALHPESNGRIADFRSLIVQTTSVGMEGHSTEDPLSFYEFHGDEFLYDIIYTPPVTPLMKRAAEAGCRTINGWDMFENQAKYQSDGFLELLQRR